MQICCRILFVILIQAVLSSMNLYDITFHDSKTGKNFDLSKYKGKVIMIVNTASQCGFTKQYSALEELWQKYKDQGFVLIAVPTNDFGGQEPGSDAEIRNFCEVNFGIDFVITNKVTSKGEHMHPIFRLVKEEFSGLSGPFWNFYKYVFGPDGKPITWFSSITDPLSSRVKYVIESNLPDKNEKNKIIILGCGISGMLISLALAEHGIKTEIIEIKDENQLLNPNDPRTIALNDSSKKFMQKISVWNFLEPFTEAIKDIYICQNMKNDSLHLKGGGADLGIMINNNDFRRELYKLVQNNDFINMRSSSSYDIKEISDDFVKLDIITSNNKTSEIASIVIAADGRFSEAKKKFFPNRMQRDYNQKALVFNIEHTKNHEGGAIEHFLPRGSFATLPLKSGLCSGVVWVENTEIADFLITQENEILEKRILDFIGGSLGEIKIITKPLSFPLSAFISEKYFQGMLALVSDSAHSMHPLAGQGLNMGIKDIECLTSLIEAYSNIGLKIDKVLLNKYERTRKLDNIAMVRITDTINKVFTSSFRPLNSITEKGMWFIDSMPILKDILVNYAKGSR